MIGRPALILAGIVTLAALAGCSTSGNAVRNGGIAIELLSGNYVQVEEQRVAVKQLPKHLKSLGARPLTKIEIAISDQTPRQTLARVTAVLAQAGFRKVLFVRPRHTTAIVSE